jgi:hypothetical protein
MNLANPRWIFRVGYVLKALSTVFTVLFVLYASYLQPGVLANVGVFAALAPTSMIDGFMADAIGNMMGLETDWKRHFLPALTVMHAGAIWSVLTLSTSSVVLPFLTWGVFIAGAMACLNQYSTI